MEQNVMIQNMWNSAGRAGLALGAVSVVFLFIEQFLFGSIESEGTALMWQLTSGLMLSGARLVICVGLLVFFMLKFANENKGADQKTIFRMGMITAFFSALMLSAIYLANMLYISADLYDDRIFQTQLEQIAPTLDSTTMEIIMGSMPQILFCVKLIYCFIFGTVASAIISRIIVTRKESSKNKQNEL